MTGLDTNYTEVPQVMRKISVFWFKLNFDPGGPIDNKSALVQVLICYQTSDKPIPDHCWTSAELQQGHNELTHWGRVMHICVNKLTISVSDNGLLPGRRQAIIWTNDGILLIRLLGTKFSEIVIEIYTFSFTKIDLKMSEKCRPFCLGLNVLKLYWWANHYLWKDNYNDKTS